MTKMTDERIRYMHDHGDYWRVDGYKMVLDFIVTQQQPATPEQEPVVTKEMVYAFHSALTDGALGQDDFKEIEHGLKAALFGYTHAQCKRCEELASKNDGFSELTALMQKSLEGDTARISELLDKLAALEARNAELEIVIQRKDEAISERTEMLQRAEKVINECEKSMNSPSGKRYVETLSAIAEYRKEDK